MVTLSSCYLPQILPSHLYLLFHFLLHIFVSLPPLIPYIPRLSWASDPAFSPYLILLRFVQPCNILIYFVSHILIFLVHAILSHQPWILGVFWKHKSGSRGTFLWIFQPRKRLICSTFIWHEAKLFLVTQWFPLFDIFQLLSPTTSSCSTCNAYKCLPKCCSSTILIGSWSLVLLWIFVDLLFPCIPNSRGVSSGPINFLKFTSVFFHFVFL